MILEVRDIIILGPVVGKERIEAVSVAVSKPGVLDVTTIGQAGVPLSRHVGL